MASGKRIIEAFSSSLLKFKVTRFSWINSYLPHYTDLNFEFLFEGKKFSGRGTADSEELALVKSAMEAIERCTCVKHGIHTNGVAAHFDLNKAKLNARNELVERDVALCHYLTRSTFTKISTALVEIQEAVKKFSLKNVEFSFFQMKQVGPLKLILCVAQGQVEPPFGIVLGLGCQVDVAQAQTSAFLECAKNVAFVLSTDKRNHLSEQNFDHAEAKPHSHFRYALHPDTKFALKSFLTATTHYVEPEALKTDFEYQELDTNFLNLGLDDLFVVRATNPQLQNMFYGKTEHLHINYKRLHEFSGKHFNFEELFTAPHIFG